MRCIAEARAGVGLFAVAESNRLLREQGLHAIDGYWFRRDDLYISWQPLKHCRDHCAEPTPHFEFTMRFVDDRRPNF